MMSERSVDNLLTCRVRRSGTNKLYNHNTHTITLRTGVTANYTNSDQAITGQDHVITVQDHVITGQNHAITGQDRAIMGQTYAITGQDLRKGLYTAYTAPRVAKWLQASTIGTLSVATISGDRVTDCYLPLDNNTAM